MVHHGEILDKWAVFSIVFTPEGRGGAAPISFPAAGVEVCGIPASLALGRPPVSPLPFEVGTGAAGATGFSQVVDLSTVFT